MNIELARFNMIEQQIRPWDVLDASVLSLLSTVRREDFVPAHHRALAFVDTQIPLLEGDAQGPCMLEPKVEARLLQALQVQRHESVSKRSACDQLASPTRVNKRARMTGSTPTTAASLPPGLSCCSRAGGTWATEPDSRITSNGPSSARPSAPSEIGRAHV